MKVIDTPTSYTKEKMKEHLLRSCSLGDTKTYNDFAFAGFFQLPQLPIDEVMAEALTELIQEGKFVINGHFSWHGILLPIFKRKE